MQAKGLGDAATSRGKRISEPATSPAGDTEFSAPRVNSKGAGGSAPQVALYVKLPGGAMVEQEVYRRIGRLMAGTNLHRGSTRCNPTRWEPRIVTTPKGNH